MARVTVVYSDVNLMYADTESAHLIYNLDAIKKEIYTILNTTPGERVFEPEFGSKLPLMLFEPMDRITEERVKTAVFDALKRWMPRIRIDSVRSYVKQDNEGQGYYLHLEYMILVNRSIGTYDLHITPNGT